MSESVLETAISTYIVPWDDLSHYAYRLTKRVSKLLVSSANRLPEDFVCPTAVVAECGDGLGQILIQCHRVWLAWDTTSALQARGAKFHGLHTIIPRLY